MESRGLEAGEAPSTIGPRYLVVFSSTHASFRLPEIRAAADYHGLRYAFVPMPEVLSPWPEEVDGGVQKTRPPLKEEAVSDTERAYMLVHLENDEAAQKLARRATCIRGIWHHWASAPSLGSVQTLLGEDEDARRAWHPWRRKDLSWSAIVDGHMRSMPHNERRERIEAFAGVLDFSGQIRLQDPDFQWCYTEEWTMPRHLSAEEELRAAAAAAAAEKQSKQQSIGYIPALGQEERERPQRQRLLAVHTGRNLTPPGRELARDRIHRMDVKKRAYIGNTTMESGMSIVHANMALAGPGKLVYDPFAGTGSLLLAAAALGATTLASDIDARMMRGRPHKSGMNGIVRSAMQYGVHHHILDSLCFDVTQHPLHRGSLFDAIVADPPYGVRAGAKRSGRRDVHKLRDAPVLLANGNWSHEQADYLPPKRPYALHDLLADLFTFALHFLVPHGRLVFWMPTMSEVEDDEGDGEHEGDSDGHGHGRDKAVTKVLELQLPPTRGLRLVAHSLQDFGSWGRRLITMEKVDDVETATAAFQNLTLPAAPSMHQQAAAAVASTSSQPPDGDVDDIERSKGDHLDKHSGRVRATDDPKDFRNQYFASRSARGLSTRSTRAARRAQRAAHRETTQ